MDVSVFPIGWHVDTSPHATGEDIGQVDDRAVQFRWQQPIVGPLAVQSVYCFGQERDAAIEYRLQMDGQFYSALQLSPWQEPADYPTKALWPTNTALRAQILVTLAHQTTSCAASIWHNTMSVW